ncbi:hypothetical protein HPB49_018142 [Dermacentor silvarum]|uniref:Uncharacterized protein n=2 Tax=Dermacentor silvarum TaxID=543639 RepID=A0ACB8DEV2_DERSI|nr:hypothetical protein HPB49_018142 [Dermacentor silvarum]
MALRRTEVAEHKSPLSAKDQYSVVVEGWQSPPGVTEKDALREDALPEDAAVHGKQECDEGTGKILHTEEEKPNTQVILSATEAKPSPGEKDLVLLRTEVAEQKPALSVKNEALEEVEGWKSLPVVTEENALPRYASPTHDDLQLRSLSSEQLEGEKVITVTESITYQRFVGELKEPQPLSRLVKRKAKAREEHGSAVPQVRSFKFSTPTGTSDYSCMVDDSSTGVVFTTVKSSSSFTGSPQCRREKTDITDEEVIYVSSGSTSPRGKLTSIKKSSSCCLVRVVDDEVDETSQTNVQPRAESPMRLYYLDFKANFQQAEAIPFEGEVSEPSAHCKLTTFLAPSISCRDDEDSRPDKDRAGKGKRATPRESYDESAYPSYPTIIPSNRSERLESSSTASQSLGMDFSHSATSARRISPPHHDSEVQSLLCCKLCGQSFFRSNPTHAELCSGYHKDAAPPAATNSVPPSPVCLEKYVLSVADEDDVSDVLRQAWRDEETAILSSTVWSLYRCVPSSFYVIREREKRPTSRGDVCASACVITFGEEVSFCGFFHVSRERSNTGLSRMLWTRMLDACQGKNVCAVMPQERAQPFLDRYHFQVSYWGDIVYCHVTLRKGSFPAPSSGSGGGVLVRNLDLKRDSESVIDYDHGVFGFDRSYYLRVALAEEEQVVKVATVTSSEGRAVVAGYAGVQTDQRGRPALRWLLADGDEAAQALMHSVVETCPKIREKGLVGIFYAASHATGVILNSVEKAFMEPWTLVYDKREPFLRYDKIVSLTNI